MISRDFVQKYLNVKEKLEKRNNRRKIYSFDNKSMPRVSN